MKIFFLKGSNKIDIESAFDNKTTKRNLLYLILIVGALLRLYICFFTSLPHMHRDSIDYFQQANTILSGGYTNYFPNGYPFIISFVKFLFGQYDITVLLLLNILLSVITIYFIFHISKKVFQNEKLALLTALIVAVLPTQINYTRWLTSEVPSAFFLVGAYYFYLLKRKWLSGIYLGFAIITRTEILPILVLIPVFEFFFRKKISWKMLWGGIIPMLLVGWYCFLKTGSFSIAGHGRVNIMYSTTASGDYVDWYFVDKHPEINTTGKALELYFDHAKDNPRQFIVDRFINIWNLWGFFPNSSAGSRSIADRLLIGVENFFMLIFGIVGWWINRRNFSCLILILPFIVVTGVHIFFLALPRYTYPVEPFMIVLGSWTLFRLFRFRVFNDNK